ncbi:MAG: penicillin-binding protein 2, partial [Pseudoalteromonas tetraodonis]
FAGFVPANAPKYAFAVLYEGSPGELLSGGRKAGR